MRLENVEGYYLKYKDSGKPVEVLDRVNYSFQNDDRTCLVANLQHVNYLLTTDRYLIVGVEVNENECSVDETEDEKTEPQPQKTVKRTNKKKGRK